MNMETIMLRKVQNCSRCGGLHLEIVAKKLLHPVKIDENGENISYNYWAMCPVSFDPILVQVKKATDKINVVESNI